jgi:hypothetical protein
MDGEIFAPQLDGRALTVDPGMHEFTFNADGVQFATQRVMIVQGQRNRFITAVARTGGKQRHPVVQQPVDKPSPTPAAAVVPTKKAATKVALRQEDEKDKELPDAAPARATASLVDTPAEPISGDDDAAGKKSGSVLPYVIGGLGVASLGAAGLLTYWGRKDNDALTQCSPTCDPGATQHIKRLYLGADVALGVGVAALAGATWLYVRSHASTEEKGSEQALHLDLAPTTSGGYASVSGRF